MKIVVDWPRCEGHGLCEEAAPQLMHLDDKGELVVDVEDVDAATSKQLRLPSASAPWQPSGSHDDGQAPAEPVRRVNPIIRA